MAPLRVLITNIRLIGASGTELYVYDVARRLRDLGHSPIVYSPQPGPLAEKLIAQAVPVVDRLERIAVTPDVIHGHHSLETMAALLRFPGTPGIFVCHDCSAWHDRAPAFPRLRRYVAVDLACRNRLTMQDGVVEDRVVTIQNGVDLRRFQPRAPLPPSPRRALLLSNNADQRTLGVVRSVCRQANIELDFAGQGLGRVSERPEDELGRYDLVFAKGRCAWEAMAVGAAVIVCDEAGSGPLVTTDRWDELAGANFGRRLLRSPLEAERLHLQIRRYDARDATEVSRRVRERADLDRIVGQLVELYDEVIAEQQDDAAAGLPSELAHAAGFLEWWSEQREEAERQLLARYRSRSTLRRWWRSLRKRIPWSA